MGGHSELVAHGMIFESAVSLMEFSQQNPSLRYEILEQIGQGSSAQVYRARRMNDALGFQQTVAIKILKSQTQVELWKRSSCHYLASAPVIVCRFLVLKPGTIDPHLF